MSDENNQDSSDSVVNSENPDANAIDEHFSEGPKEEQFEDQPKSAEEQIAELQAELEETQKRALMAQAELENFRKRTRRDVEQERQYAQLSLLRDLLPVIDNLQLALAVEATDADLSGIIDGVRMVAQQLVGVLKENRCETIEAEGLPFNPEVHEAVEQRETNEHEVGIVMEVRQTGYQLHDRVIRPARVVVARANENCSTEASSDEGVVEHKVE